MSGLPVNADARVGETRERRHDRSGLGNHVMTIEAIDQAAVTLDLRRGVGDRGRRFTSVRAKRDGPARERNTGRNGTVGELGAFRPDRMTMCGGRKKIEAFVRCLALPHGPRGRATNPCGDVLSNDAVVW